MIEKYFLSTVMAAGILSGCKPKTEPVLGADASIAAEENINEEASLNCKPAGGVFGFLAAAGVYDAWDDRPVEPLTIAKFTPNDDKPLPLKFIYRFTGQDFEMPVYNDGTVIMEYSVLDPEGDGELCVLDPARVGDAPGGLGLDINTEFVFKKNTAGYSIDALEAGTILTTEYMTRVIKMHTGADLIAEIGTANWIYLRALASSDEDWKVPKNAFMKGDQVVALTEAIKGDDFLKFSLEDAKAIGADRWVISGRDYALSAVFDPENVPENYKDILGVK